MKYGFPRHRFAIAAAICLGACSGAVSDQGGNTAGASGAHAGRSGRGAVGGINATGGTSSMGGTAGMSPSSGGGGGKQTVDAGARMDAPLPVDVAPPVDPDQPPPGYVPSIVAVGYGGLRVLSKDGGRTWGNRAALTDGNNEWTLLRTVAYARGLYVAVGNAGIFASSDGANWQRFLDDIGFLQGIAYGNKTWVGGGGCGATVLSQDGGKTWRKGPTITKQLPSGNCVHIRSVAFANGFFYASDDGNVVHKTADGLTWTIDPKLSFYQIAYCDGFKERAGCRPQGLGGVFIQPNGYRLERSTDAKTWQSVYTDSGKNEFFWPCNPIAFGFSPP